MYADLQLRILKVIKPQLTLFTPMFFGDVLTMPFPCSLPAADIPKSKHPLPPIPPPKHLADRNILRHSAKRLFQNIIAGSESVVEDIDGSLLMFDKYGYLWKAPPSTSSSLASLSTVHEQPQRITYIGPGRPLGFHLYVESQQEQQKDDNKTRRRSLIICDTKGLLKLDLTTFKLQVLTNYAGNRPIMYANDLDIDDDDSGNHQGMVYFTDSGNIPPALNHGHDTPWYDTFRSFTLTYLQGSATGRLLSYNLKTGETGVLIDGGIWYANGAALSHDGTWVAVVETCTCRVYKYWLKGPKKGETEVWIPSLPGFPDNICRSYDGRTYWVCIVAPDLPILRKIVRSKRLRWLAAHLPEWLKPKPKKVGMVLRVDEWGKVVDVLSDDGGENVAFVSSVSESRDGKTLWLGNVVEDYVSELDLSHLY
jgi:sugar lactone lactonase YvrE